MRCSVLQRCCVLLLAGCVTPATAQVEDSGSGAAEAPNVTDEATQSRDEVALAQDADAGAPPNGSDVEDATLSIGGRGIDSQRLPFLYPIDVIFESGTGQEGEEYQRCLATRIRPGGVLVLLTAAHCVVDDRHPTRRISAVVVRSRFGRPGPELRPADGLRILVSSTFCSRRGAASDPPGEQQPGWGHLRTLGLTTVVAPTDNSLQHELDRRQTDHGSDGMVDDFAVIVVERPPRQPSQTWDQVLGRTYIPVRREIKATEDQAEVESESAYDSDGRHALAVQENTIAVGYNCTGVPGPHDRCERTSNEWECDARCVQDDLRVGYRVPHSIGLHSSATYAVAEPDVSPLLATGGDSGGPLLRVFAPIGAPPQLSYEAIVRNRPTVVAVLSLRVTAHGERHFAYEAGDVLENAQCHAWREVAPPAPGWCFDAGRFGMPLDDERPIQAAFDSSFWCMPGG